MYYVVGFLSAIVILVTTPIGLAQNGQESVTASSNLKTPAARISESHRDLAKKAGAKAHATKRAADGQTNEPNHIVTSEEHQAIPYRPCINARGWKNGRLVCANEVEAAPRQNGHEIEGPYSPR
jgi:hypothetical protein